MQIGSSLNIELIVDSLFPVNMWDQRRKTAHSHEWGKIFAEKTKQVLDDVENGVPDALSKWMETERLLVMPHEQCLRVPAIEFVNYERYGKQ